LVSGLCSKGSIIGELERERERGREKVRETERDREREREERRVRIWQYKNLARLISHSQRRESRRPPSTQANSNISDTGTTTRVSIN
jgi:hypothetical protein